jgi:hypothetical protein
LHRFITSRGHACAVERAADTLHCARIDSKPRRDLAHQCDQEPLERQGFAFRGLPVPGPSELFPLILGPPKPGTDSFLNHRALELGKHIAFAGRLRGIEALLVQEKVMRRACSSETSACQ